MTKKNRTWRTSLTVVGLGFRWKRETREMMPGWCPFPVKFEREPDNRFDPDAIKVVIAGDFKLTKLRGMHLGYLSNRIQDGERVGIATMLAPKLDAGRVEVVKAWVTEVDPGDGTAVVEVRFRDIPPAKRGVSASKKKGKTKA
jgi:hypothetical protein